MYAVVQTGGKQYKVTEGNTIEVNRVGDEAGSALTLDNVLLVNQDGSVKIGTPTIEGAKVEARFRGRSRYYPGTISRERGLRRPRGATCTYDGKRYDD